MIKYEFNRNEFEWAEEFYEIMQKRMDLPDWFGKNPDALWDMLTGHIELPCEITLIGFDRKENDYNQMELNQIFTAFQHAEEDFPKYIKIIRKN